MTDRTDYKPSAAALDRIDEIFERAVAEARLHATGDEKMTRRHTLTFEGDVPEDEMARAAVLAHPKVQAATQELAAAFAEAGHPHSAVSKTIKVKAAPAPRPATARAAE